MSDDKDLDIVPSDDNGLDTPANNDDKNKKSDNIWIRGWRAWCDWWKLTWESYVVEIEDRILMSWKRIIKFAGITVIPIVYGVVCTMAFWNPIDSMGKAPLGIMDEDYTVLTVSKFDTDKGSNGKYNFDLGAVKSFGAGSQDDAIMQTNTGLNPGDYILPDNSNDSNNGIRIKNSALKNEKQENEIEATIFKNALTMGNGEFNLTNNESVGYDVNNSGNNIGFTFKLTTAWDLIRSALNPKTDENKEDTKYTFSAPELPLGEDHVTFEKITYINNPDTINDQWQRTKYWSQVKIPTGFTERLISYAGLMLNNDNGQNDKQIDKLVSSMTGNQLQFWSTHERNFIYGYLIQTVAGIMPGVVMQYLPAAGNIFGVSAISNAISTNGAQVKALGFQTVPDGKGGVEDVKSTSKYVLAKSSGLSVNVDQGLLNDATLFGDVDSVVGNVTSSNVGGRFINGIQTLIKLVQNSNILKILGDLQLFPVGVQQTVTELGNKFIAGLDNAGSEIQSSSKIVEKTDKLQLASTIPSPIDTGIVGLNKAVYELNMGKRPDGDALKAINAVWKALTGNNFPDDFKLTPLFGATEKIINLTLYESRFNDLIKNNTKYFFNATNINEIIPNAFDTIMNTKLHGLTMDKVVSMDIQGSEYNIYGFGLGVFFLTLGLFVGAFTQTFVFDRAKRLAKSKWSNWYFSKSLLMLTMAFFQVTCEVWIIYACGWSAIGAGNMCLVWLWLLFCDAVFVSIVQGLWFSLKDETVGKFCIIIVMVFSIGAGGGEFPSLSQLGFYNAIGYIVPFTYVFHGFDEILFGVALQGTQTWSTNWIFEQIGILLIYVFIFGGLGIAIGAPNRMKEMDYGSHYGYAVAGAMRALGMNVDDFQVLRKVTRKGKKRYSYDWSKLGNKFQPDLYFQCRKMYKFEGQFKWWAKKHHDFVQKPNYSDEEIVSRNE